MNSKLSVAVNKNPTKLGIKVQFTFPEGIEGDNKDETRQKLQNKLSKGLQQHGLTINADPDVPYDNIVGFLIPIGDIKQLVKKALSNEV